MKYGITIVWIALAMVLMATNALASGFALPYIPDKTLTVYRGVPTLIPVTLQNGENKSIRMFFVQTDGKNISTLTNESFPDVTQFQDEADYVADLGPYTYDHKIYLNITVPKDAEPGQRWRVAFTVKSTEPTSTGMITFATQVGGGFEVTSVENPNEFKLKAWHIILPVAILVILGVVGYSLYQRKQSKDEEEKPTDPLEDMLH